MELRSPAMITRNLRSGYAWSVVAARQSQLSLGLQRSFVCGDTKSQRNKRNKAKAGLICGIIGIIGSVILITVFVVNILLSSDFQNEMKEFNTHYDTYIDENDDSI